MTCPTCFTSHRDAARTFPTHFPTDEKRLVEPDGRTVFLASKGLCRERLDFLGSDGAGGTGRGACIRAYVDALVTGTKLDWRPTKKEQEQEIFDLTKRDELRRLAREEAKAERAAAKAAAKKAADTKKE